MVDRSEKNDPIRGVLGRLMVALMKRTGTRLSAAEVQALAPLFLQTIRRPRRRPSRQVRAKPSH